MLAGAGRRDRGPALIAMVLDGDIAQLHGRSSTDGWWSQTTSAGL